MGGTALNAEITSVHPCWFACFAVNVGKSRIYNRYVVQVQFLTPCIHVDKMARLQSSDCDGTQIQTEGRKKREAVAQTQKITRAVLLN